MFETLDEGTGAWLEVTFDACYVLIEMHLYSAQHTQTLDVEFDDESVQTVSCTRWPF